MRKDRARNETIRAQTKLEKVDVIIKDRKPRWLGRFLGMDDDRLQSQALHWELDTTERKPGRPRKTGTTLYVKT